MIDTKPSARDEPAHGSTTLIIRSRKATTRPTSMILTAMTRRVERLRGVLRWASPRIRVARVDE